ncbi:DNA methyltransferase [Aeromonas caviae]|uniref:DNA methyltransferase n=1 Tax=Aeromonas caviae TaxID=648 RepID=UPI002B49FE9F|nr:DNA methyltransferase [Aeromonas caviae]
MQQESLFSSDMPQQDQVAGPVTCLGKTFANAQARRDYFLAMLAEKLKDPEFRKIEGFPIGSDENILNLSDPPYYTACPNPWISDFVTEWEVEKQASDYKYHREPFAADVSEGKNDPIYNAHSYHTKVPHKAIMRYILHYTQPGDTIFDGFCGTGMSGVAAQMCGDREAVQSLGYQVLSDGTILREEEDDHGKKVWRPFSKLGFRKAILADLSPAATFIANNYNTPIDVAVFEVEVKRILKDIEQEYGWMYETLHVDGKTKGKINYTIWSDVFMCPECAEEVVYWDNALDREAGKVLDEFPCPHCSTRLHKRNMERVWVNKFDFVLNSTVKHAKQVPVIINYIVDGKKHQKKPDPFDLGLIEKIESSKIPHWIPIYELQDGFNTKQPKISHGFDHVHQFYTKRNLWLLSAVWERLLKAGPRFPFLFTASQRALSKMASIAFTYFFHGGGGFINAGTKGTLYVSSTNPEVSVFHSLTSRIRSLVYSFNACRSNCIIETKSTTASSSILDNSLDYIFIDPPFGANINYSELNTLWEPWLGVTTNINQEAIENSVQGKGLPEYRELMTKAFSEAYRILKPGRWITVEFSNTRASVWNNIQTAITEAGFVVANVSALDKKQGSFKAYTTPTAVKQDLVISAYKPNGGFEERFREEAQTEEGVWDFIRTHLQYLPVTKQQSGSLQFIQERDPRILFDQMVAYYVRKGYAIPVSSHEFQLGLSQRFIQRDGMYFMPEQVSEYDRKKMSTGELKQMTMFVTNEASAIQWLRQFIKDKPLTFSDINPQFMQQLSGWSKNEMMLDLRELLSQNFLCYDGQDDVPDQIHSYLSSNWKELRNLAKNDPALVAKAKDRWYVPDPNKAGDLEKLREKSLLKEFEEYKAAKKKLKVFRIEAVRVGFKKLWEQQKFAALISVAEKLPNNVLEEDPVLLMYYDQAVTLSQVDADDEW